MPYGAKPSIARAYMVAASGRICYNPENRSSGMLEEPITRVVERLKESLGVLPEPVSKPALVMVSGLPGTGKSHFSRCLAERVPFTILETDQLRSLLFPNPTHSAEESRQLFQVCHRLIEELLREGIRVVFDATNLVERHREYLYHAAESMGAKLIIVQVKAPAEVVRQRLEGRQARVDTMDHSQADWNVYQRMQKGVERIRRNYFSVDTSRDIGPVLDKIVRELR